VSRSPVIGPPLPKRIAGLFAVAIALTAVALASPSGAGASAASLTATLSPAQLAGQRVIYSYAGRTPPARLLWLISHGRAAGVVFFGDNITGHTQIRAVVARLEKANAATTNPVQAPLLLMTDQEGGQVRRLSGAPLLSEKQIGASDEPEAKARSAGAGAAHNLTGVGMDLNLAPVLDVYRTAGDFIDRLGRSYSSDPSLVATLSGVFITAQQQAGVAATAKHFPGLGAATLADNTDLGPVTLNISLSKLRSVDELPYATAVAHGVRLVMVSWAVYPALDPRRPAGLSSSVVQGELRRRLGFRGVTITDALEAGAVEPFGTIAHRSILASRAGMDLLLCSQRRVAEGEYAAATLRQGYLDGTLRKAAFTAAVERVIALRQRFGH
jgi:beta-N-acetylhexosaminidase